MFGGELALRHHNRAAGLGERRGVRGLILIERMRKGHQDGSPADDRELGDGRSAGAADDEMGGGDPRRQIGEEFRDLDRKVHARARRRNARAILAARLLGEADPLALVRVHQRERRRNDIRHDAGALRAAGHQKVQALSDVFRIGGSQQRR